MTEINKLFFETDIQVKIFFVLINKAKGITRDTLSKRIEEARTTIFDNLSKLENRILLTKQNKEIPYVKHYKKKIQKGKGRPSVFFYIPKAIRRYYMEINKL